MIQEKLHKEMIECMKSGNTGRKDNLKFLLGQFQTASKNREKTVTDEEAIKIMKNLMKAVNDTMDKILETKGKQSRDYSEAVDFVALCEENIPKNATRDQIIEFLDTIDFSQLKNKMQAVGLTTKHFCGNVDSNEVKEIVMER